MAQPQIIRTPTKATGGITAEEREKMRELSNLWIQRAYRTEPIEPDKITPAILGIYEAAGLKAPRVVIVPSPRVMAFAGGFAAAIWWLRKNPDNPFDTTDAIRAVTSKATDAAAAAAAETTIATSYAIDSATKAAAKSATNATDLVTSDATDTDTDNATDTATDLFTRAPTDAIYVATKLATLTITSNATKDIDPTLDTTIAATAAATSAAAIEATQNTANNATKAVARDFTNFVANLATTDAATKVAMRTAAFDDVITTAVKATRGAAYDSTTYAVLPLRPPSPPPPINPHLVKFFLLCAQRWSVMYQGGNMWPAWVCYLAACRDILGLQLPTHDKFAHFEAAAIHGGFRIMHEEFCMVSDFPEIIKVDSDHRPHCEDGPSHRWSDGWELYHWHGIRTTEQVIMHPDTITAQQVQAEENAELRRVMVERMGWEKYCGQAKMRVIHTDTLTTHLPTLPVSELVDDAARLVTDFRSGTETAELLEAGDLRDFGDRPMRFVRLTDPSTGRQYVLRVLHDHARCYEAVGWTFGMTEQQYKTSRYIRQGDVGLIPLQPNALPYQQHS